MSVAALDPNLKNWLSEWPNSAENQKIFGELVGKEKEMLTHCDKLTQNPRTDCRWLVHKEMGPAILSLREMVMHGAPVEQIRARANLSIKELDAVKIAAPIERQKTKDAFSRMREAIKDPSPAAQQKEVSFPSKDKLSTCLSKHPLTRDPYFQEKGINQAAVDFFADSTRVRSSIPIGVMGVVGDLNEKLGLRPSTTAGVEMNLTEALQDCAKRDRGWGCSRGSEKAKTAEKP